MSLKGIESLKGLWRRLTHHTDRQVEEAAAHARNRDVFAQLSQGIARTDSPLRERLGLGPAPGRQQEQGRRMETEI